LSATAAARSRITIIGAAEAQRAATLLEEQGYGVSVAPVMEDSA